MATLRKTVRDSLIIAWRSLVKTKRTPEQWADVTVMPVFFMLMFTFLFGGAIAGDTVSYLPIIVPGILIQTNLGISAGTGTALKQDMETGIFDRFKSLPIARISPLADIPRYGLSTLIAMATGVLLGWRPGAGLIWIFPAALLAIVFSGAISWLFAFCGLLARKASTVQSISMTIMFALTFLSNAFVTTDTLPHWLQAFVKVNPVTHVIAAIREMLNSGRIGADFWLTLGLALMVVVVFAPLTLKMYNRKM